MFNIMIVLSIILLLCFNNYCGVLSMHHVALTCCFVTKSLLFLASCVYFDSRFLINILTHWWLVSSLSSFLMWHVVVIINFILLIVLAIIVIDVHHCWRDISLSFDCVGHHRCWFNVVLCYRSIALAIFIIVGIACRYRSIVLFVFLTFFWCCCFSIGVVHLCRSIAFFSWCFAEAVVVASDNMLMLVSIWWIVLLYF